MKYFISFFIAIAGFSAKGQFISNQVISSQGQELTTSDFLISHTVGETFYEGGTAGEIIVTTGFIQPAIDEALSIDELALIKAISIHPNPAQNQLNIVLPTYFENMVIRITSLLGQELMNYPVEGERTTLNIENLNSGTYILTMRSLEFTKTFKIIKK